MKHRLRLTVVGTLDEVTRATCLLELSERIERVLIECADALDSPDVHRDPKAAQDARLLVRQLHGFKVVP